MSNAVEHRESYSTDEVCAIVGISYRMLDYWLRRGYITIESPARGSGTQRRFTTDETAALACLVDRYNALNKELDQLADGTMWAAMMADGEKGTNDVRGSRGTARQRHPSASRPSRDGLRLVGAGRGAADGDDD